MAASFSKKVDGGYGGLSYDERAGYVVTEFGAMLESLSDSLANPSKFSQDRKTVVRKYIKYLGADSRKAVIREIKRLCG